MENQINLFDLEQNGYQKQIQDALDSVAKEYELPAGCLVLKEQVNNKNEGEYLVLILEPPYPLPQNCSIDSYTQTSALILKECHSKKDIGKIDIKVFDSIASEVEIPQSFQIMKAEKSEYITIRTAIQNPELSVLVAEIIKVKLKYYSSKSSFSCCSHFLECSDARNCVHKNKLYSTGCQYRRHLDAGEIFYGKNRNID